jgi:diguanylate cyclase (GGDEF)-like protein/PAS domain S-box-containing protein
MESNNEFNILIIDDNKDIHEDFFKILVKHDDKQKDLLSMTEELFGAQSENKDMMPNFVVDAALSGEEGLQKVLDKKKENTSYALAFVDMRMPNGWDGIETIKQLWNADQDIQIVICTAYSDYSWEETINQLGTGDNLLILKKPFDIVAARQLAFAMTKKWKLLQESRKHTHDLEENVLNKSHTIKTSLSILRAILESSADGILIVDSNGALVDYNPKLTEFFPKIKDAGIKNIIQEKITPELVEQDIFISKIKELDDSSDTENFDTIKLKSGKVLEYYTRPYSIDEKTIDRVWNFRDVTVKTLLRENLNYQAKHDMLTNLPNRVLLLDRIEQAIKSADRNKSKCAVFFIDLDKFKAVNDTLGHDAGDQMLIRVAKILQNIGRKTDTVARLGGDEFVILIGDFKNDEDLLVIAKKVIAAIAVPFVFKETEFFITCSIGISIYPQDGSDAKELLHSSDLAMYTSKNSGANSAKFYSAELNEHIKIHFKVEQEMRAGIKNHAFFLVYQPQYNVITKKIIGIEALLRWNHPVRGVLEPEEFLAIAETSGLIVPIGYWAIESVCEQIKKWQEKNIQHVTIAINLSEEQIRKPDFFDNIMNIVNKYDIEPRMLELELSENIVINHDIIVKTVQQLSGAGFHLSFDDFGTGNSTLSYLRTTPIDQLKIDKSFINNIKAGSTDTAIVGAIIAVAKSMNLQVMAEGVETEQQLNYLIEQKCEAVQGFLFSKPLSVDDVEQVLQGKLMP